MNIQELENKHGDIPLEPLNFDEFHYKKHAKLSVEFAISVLESLEPGELFIGVNDKIQELKQYLNE
jgi:hypothetical protein